MFVEEYTSEFYNIATRSEFSGNQDVLTSMYQRGLNFQISCGLAASRLYSMDDLVQIACQMEEVRKKTLIRPLVDTLTRSDRTLMDPIRGEFFNKSRASSSNYDKPEGFNSSVAKSSNIIARISCFNRQDKGYQSCDCPSPRHLVGVVHKEDPKEALEFNESKLDVQVVS